MRRRTFLQAMAVGVASSTQIVGQPAGPTLVQCDAATLKRVLVHEPGGECRKALYLPGVDHALHAAELLRTEVQAEHRQLVRALQADGVEVLTFRKELQAAIEAARSAGALEGWTNQYAPWLRDLDQSLEAGHLIGSEDAVVYRKDGAESLVRRGARPLKFLMLVRDLATMTPSGLVIGHNPQPSRAFEIDLFKFLLAWSPRLTGLPVAYDATADRLLLQCGDLIVADEKSVWLGVGNQSDERLAPRLARALGRDVVTVQLPTQQGFRNESPLAHGNNLRVTFLHLDTIINLVAPGVALAVPYFLESAHADRDPLSTWLRSLGEEFPEKQEYFERMARSLASVGWVRRYKARSGEIDTRLPRMKLVDLLRDQGYRIVPLGGDAQGIDAAKHVVEHVMHELRFQGANVVATRPGRVVGFSENSRTITALKAAGIEVAAIEGSEIARWHGGPHCLTLPLERG
jgi:arginine deiminase